MPVSIVVGGQFGSEGKGKIALEIARRAKQPVTVVRVGGPNSGHTGYDRRGKKWALRQLPAGCIDRNADVVFPAGSYIDIRLLNDEIAALEYPRERVFISPYARIIVEEHRAWEREAGLVGSIGSTGSGVGGAVLASVARSAANVALPSPHASDFPELAQYVADTCFLMRNQLDQGRRVIIEGTQGFGLSLLEGGYWPKATSRSTTASGALAEAGLSPLDVDDITMVMRSYPIRVAGDSGPLVDETTWDEIAQRAARADDIREYTTVTNKLRRVGRIDFDLLRSAIHVNNPTRLVINHLDYVDGLLVGNVISARVRHFLATIESELGRPIDWLGFDPTSIREFAGQTV